MRTNSTVNSLRKLSNFFGLVQGRLKSFGLSILLLTVFVTANSQGYIYVHKKAMDESQNVNFDFTISNGTTTVSTFQLNDNATNVRIKDLGSAQNGRLWAVGKDNNLYYRNSGSSGWVNTGITNASRVDGGPGGICYYSTTTGNVFTHDGTTATQIYSGTDAIDVASTWSGQPFMIAATNTIFRYNGPGTAITDWPRYSNKANPIDLANNGVSVNDGITSTGQPNLLLDYPVFTAYNNAGTNMIVSGYIGQCNGTENGAGNTISGTTVQVYKVADDGDQNGAISGNGCSRSVTHGEGIQYLGSISVTGGTFTNATFSMVPGATFGANDKITGITIDAAGNTSEFGVIVNASMLISGTVFNDINNSGSTAGNSIQDGSEFGTTAGANLWAYLINNGVIVDSTQVAQYGTYVLDGFSTTSYSIELSRQQYAIGTTGVTVSTIDNTMATGWSLTGEGAVNTADGTTNGTISLTTPASGNSINNNFGVLQPLSCATTELMAETRFIFTPTGDRAVSTFNSNGWVGTGSGLAGAGSGDTYIYDNLYTQTFTHAFTGINPLGSGAVINASLGVRNGVAGSPVITNFGKATVLTFKYGGVSYATVTTDGTTATDGHIATVNYLNSATGSVPNGYTFDYGPSPQGWGVVSLANWQIFLPASVPNNGDLAVEYNPGGTSAGDAADDFTLFAVSLKACLLTISGNVWNDANGNAVNSSENPITSGVWVNLVDPITHAVIQSVQVDGSGNYSFTGLPQNTSYDIIITTSNQAGNLDLTSSTLPADYVATGTNLTGTASTANKTGVVNVNTGTGGLTEQNFGIEKRPDSDAQSQSVPTPTGKSIPVGTVTTPVTGSDAEQGTLTNTSPIVITKLPTGGTIMYYFNGTSSVPVTAGQVIPNFNPALLSYSNIPNGASSVVFQYAFIDAAGQQDLSPADYTVFWTTPLPITLENFTAKATACDKVQLSWKISNAINFSHFEIEKSTNGTVFHPVGLVMYDQAYSNYTFNEYNISKGNYQYRLKMIDTDGSIKYSAVVFIRLDCNQQQILLYPNPVINDVTISGLKKNDKINLYAINGSLVYSKNATGDQHQIDMTKYTAGGYRIIVSNENDGILYSTTLIKALH